ncbi:MAG: F0F1 ATP synthase subunit delta [Coriobacteriia bacterium]|nr:ATP synthase F1 subunit delta [Anaerosomatales bacterium]
MGTKETVDTLARTLIELASLSDAVDAVDADLASVVKAVRGHIDLRQALTDTTLPAEKKRDILRDIFGESVAPETLAIVTLMVERGLTDQLGDLARRYREIAESERGVVVAEVTTAVPLTDALRAKIVDKLSASLGASVSLREQVDERVLGGVRINVSGRVLDGTVKSQLEGVRQTLSSARSGGEA